MVAKRVTITVPSDLHKKMEKWKNKLNFSKVFQEAITREIEKKELFIKGLEESRSMLDVWNNSDLSTPQGQFRAGKDMGFIYARTAPYPEVKQYEQYVKNWDKQEKDELEKFYYDLDAFSILSNLGLFRKGKTFKLGEKIPVGDQDIPLTSAFDFGFMGGIMDYLREQIEEVRINVLVLERLKEMRQAKNEKEKAKITRSYIPKFLGEKSAKRNSGERKEEKK